MALLAVAGMAVAACQPTTIGTVESSVAVDAGAEPASGPDELAPANTADLSLAAESTPDLPVQSPLAAPELVTVAPPASGADSADGDAAGAAVDATAPPETATPLVAAPTTSTPTTAPAPAPTAPPAAALKATAPETSAPASSAAPASDASAETPADADPGPQLVEFRIPAGTGDGPWNTFETMVVVYVGDTLRVHNDDSRAHTIHTNGKPFGHGNKIKPGTYTDYTIKKAVNVTQSRGPATWEHGSSKSKAPFWLTALTR